MLQLNYKAYAKNKILLIIKLLRYLIYGTIHTVLLIRYYSYGAIDTVLFIRYHCFNNLYFNIFT